MNRDELRQLWDDYRDGALGAEQRRAFEQMLTDSQAEAALYEAETRWIASLHDDDASPRDVDGFVDVVLGAWQTPTVAGRIGFGSPLRWAMGLAAMIAVAAGGAIFSRLIDVPDAQPGRYANIGDPSTDGETDATPSTPLTDPVTALVRGTRGNFVIAAAQPKRIGEAVSRTTDLLDVGALIGLLDPGVPDPAQFIEPAGS